MRTLIIIFLCFMSSAVWAVDAAQMAEAPQVAEAPDYEQIARERLYPGGENEEDLRVQENLPVAEQGTSEKTLQTKYLKQILNRRQASEAPSDTQ